MTYITKFTPLQPKQISQVVKDIDGAIFALHPLIKHKCEEYKKLIDLWHVSDNKLKFLNKNIELVAKFLNETRLIGYKDEHLTTKGINDLSYVIGSEGLEVISAYIKNKPRNINAHPVQVIKNTADPTCNHTDLFLENKGVHFALKEQLCKDLEEHKDKDFNKSYIIEIFGTTGGNHFLTLTVRKKPDEKSPIFDLFDPSPAMLRGGKESAKNSIAIGWCGQLIVNATIKAASTESDIQFDINKFYNNSEPLQAAGHSLCGTFACEMAYLMARMTRKNHEHYLQDSYQFDSPYGGKTEILLNITQYKFLTKNEDIQLALPAEYLQMSHFIDSSIAPAKDDLLQLTHDRKHNNKESLLERITRYQSADDGNNLIASEKTYRQKLGHLFEIVTSKDFLQLQPTTMDLPKQVDGSPYFPTTINHKLTEGFAAILPSYIRLHSLNCEDDLHKATLYLGEDTAKKMIDFMSVNNVSFTRETIDLGQNIEGVDKEIREICKITLLIENYRVSDLVYKMKEKGQLCDRQEHLFTTPKSSQLLEINSPEPDRNLFQD